MCHDAPCVDPPIRTDDDLVWSPTFTLITCEHGGAEIPPAYEHLFAGAGDVLATHRGLDLGALPVAHRLAARLALPILFSTTTRLLVDLNRSPDSPSVFSEFTRDLSEPERARILADHHEPHRETVRTIVAAALDAGHRVLHVGVHSCTDILDGRVRDLDIALLFDPARPSEAELCDRWLARLRSLAPTLRHRFNEPYKGTDDGLTTTLRQSLPPDRYAGIEVELRQGLIPDAPTQRAAAELLAESLRPLLRLPIA